MPRPRLLALLAAAALVAGCGDDPPRVTVTEAEDDARPAQRPSLAFDTVYADSGLFADPRLRPDSLRRDSLRRDSLRADSLRQDLDRQAAAPDFRTFWPAFQQAVREGPGAVRRMTAFSERLGAPSFEMLHDLAFVGEPYRGRVLALTPRDFERDGTARQVHVLVGYDGDGNVVPQDEAVTESSVSLRFEIVNGAYRLVEIRPAG